MDRDRNHRRPAQLANYRSALGWDPQNSGSTSTAMMDRSLLGASISGDHIRQSQSRFTREVRSTSSVSGSQTPRNLHAYGDTAPSQHYSSRGDHYSTSSGFTESYLTPSYSSQIDYGDTGVTNPYTPRQFDRSPPGYQGPATTAAEVLSDQFAAQPFFGLDDFGVSESLNGPATGSLREPMHISNACGGQQTQMSLLDGLSESRRPQKHQQERSNPPKRAIQQDTAGHDPQSVGNRLLKQTNSNSLRGRLLEARATLLRLTYWLTDNVETLGLTEDVDTDIQDWRSAHKERLKFWADIHHCWLVFLQRQYDDTKSNGGSSKSKRSKEQHTLSKEMLEEMGDEVVRISDHFEKFGLVDYEMGVQEKELITLIQQCINLLDRNKRG